MKLVSKIIERGVNYRLSELYIDGVFFCNVLEDTDRGLKSTMPLEEIKRIKIIGRTAIPIGEYRITIDVVSPKFSKYEQYKDIEGKLPRLLNVPGYEGVLIHIGNKPEDTDGCLLVGEKADKGTIKNSTATFKRLYKILLEAHKRGENIDIKIQ